MRVLMACVLIAVTFGVCVDLAQAKTDQKVRTAKQVWHHTDGYIKAIGRNARRTIYHPNPRISHRWRRDLHYLVRVRHRAYLILHPAPQVSFWPPHHALWGCLSKSEGSPTSVNPAGYYGMLQMHADWGYGTSHHASDDSQVVQEWAAERAYAASHYARSFLDGQWLRWDGAYNCLSDA